MTPAVTERIPILDPLIGQRIGGYRVTKPIGEGGMGKVYLLVHVNSPQLRRVLKVLHDSMAYSQVVERFLLEARAAASLSHPNVIEILDYDSFPDSGRPYLVMPFLDGVDLGEYVAQTSVRCGHPGRLPFELALSLLLQVCAALRAAHARGIVHRDLKLSNCYVVTGEDGRAPQRAHPRLILLDFGIAKVLDPDLRQRDATRTRAVLGTPGYMAPEQARGLAVDHRADIYAFGVLTYEILTGHRPFQGLTSEDLAIQQVSTTPPEPAALVPAIPGEVSRLIMQCLSPVPSRRPGTVMEVAHRLIHAARNGLDVAREAAKDLLSPSAVAGPTEPTVLNGPVAGAVRHAAPTVSSRRLRRRAVWGGLALACSAGTVLFASRMDRLGGADDAMAAQAMAATRSPPASVPDAGGARSPALSLVPDANTARAISDSTPDAGVAREAVPAPTPTHVTEPSQAGPRAQIAGNGTLSIKVKPWALAWCDGQSLGQTPIHAPIGAGRHWLKLQRPDGTTETVQIAIRPDRETTVARDWSK